VQKICYEVADGAKELLPKLDLENEYGQDQLEDQPGHDEAVVDALAIVGHEEGCAEDCYHSKQAGPFRFKQSPLPLKALQRMSLILRAL
jgi:hypothetical protein